MLEVLILVGLTLWNSYKDEEAMERANMEQMQDKAYMDGTLVPGNNRKEN